ncbi:MAG: 30S ribosomal protein S6 [Chthonomonadales bacterium]|nr:30S ribosomal protein S6 [Chthonomonadales bacterium]
MRRYEAMYIVDPELTEEQLEPVMEKYKKVVADMGGAVGETGKWEQGRRRMAYEIGGRREGLYILMGFEAGPEVPAELDRVFRISDDVFRHVIVRQDGQ